MSQEINNKEYRKSVVKQMISDLHAGKSVDEVKAQFKQAFDGVSASEISEAEQELIANGLPVEEVQRLCDVHAAVFRESLAEPQTDPTEVAGHPVHTFKLENRALEAVIENNVRPHLAAFLATGSADTLKKLRAGFELLRTIDLHYSKKENLIFPYLEKNGISGPPKVMWGVDDEIRREIKETRQLLTGDGTDRERIREKVEATLLRITDMIFKEEHILFPMMLEHVGPAELKSMADGSFEIGFCLIPEPPEWEPQAETALEPELAAAGLPADSGTVRLPSGVLNVAEITYLLNTLPVDITFVDKNDEVKYFSQGTERVFARTTSIIGRKVANCHPPASVHIVESIVADLRSGKKDHEDFWIRMGEKFILIRYFAVRDANGEFLGTLEVTQNIAPIQAIQGEKRLVSMDPNTRS